MLLIWVSASNGMQGINERAVQPEHYPRSTICFLHHYVRAHFCDVDDTGLYFSGINPDESDVSFILPWPQVKTILEKAFSDIEKYKLTNQQTPLQKEYREALEQIIKFHEAPRVEWDSSSSIGVFNLEAENRSLYKGTLLSGNAELVKSALKNLKLSSLANIPH